MKGKKVCIVGMAVITCFLLACSKESKPAQITQSSSPSSTTSQSNPTTSPDSDETKDKTVEVYTIDMEQMTTSPLKTNLKRSDVTPKLIVDVVISNIDEKVGVSQIKQDGTRVTVVFKSGMAPLKGCEGKMEELILECISNSLLDNIDSCQSVVFQSERGPYESGHFSFGMNEAYATN